MAFEGWLVTFGHVGQAYAAGITGIEEIRKAHDEKGYLAFACQLTKATSTFNSGGISGATTMVTSSPSTGNDSEECENNKLDASMVIDRSHPSICVPVVAANSNCQSQMNWVAMRQDLLQPF